LTCTRPAKMRSSDARLDATPSWASALESLCPSFCRRSFSALASSASSPLKRFLTGRGPWRFCVGGGYDGLESGKNPPPPLEESPAGG
jgi:hypothetical protein